MVPLTIGFTEVRKRLSEVTDEVNRTGRPVIVLKNNRPWVSIAPINHPGDGAEPAIQDAIEAFRSMRSEAADRGFLTDAEIEEEIASVRKQRT